MGTNCRVLLVSGSLRHRSTSSAALRTAAQVAPDGVTAVLFDGLAALPHFNPDDDVAPLPAAVDGFRSQVHAADALLFSTPEYAGALPGSFKNLLDWAIGDDAPRSIYGKPAGWLNVSPRGAAGAHDELRRVLGYAGAALVEPACVLVPVSNDMIDDGGLVADEGVQAAIIRVVAALAAHASRAENVTRP
jgi:NAD(P)H-dependent FMN reductase